MGVSGFVLQELIVSASAIFNFCFLGDGGVGGGGGLSKQKVSCCQLKINSDLKFLFYLFIKFRMQCLHYNNINNIM